MIKNENSILDSISGYLSSIPIQVILIIVIALVLNTIVRIAISRFVKSAIKRANDKAPQYKKIADKDRKSTRLNSSHTDISRMPSSA